MYTVIPQQDLALQLVYTVKAEYRIWKGRNSGRLGIQHKKPAVHLVTSWLQPAVYTPSLEVYIFCFGLVLQLAKEEKVVVPDSTYLTFIL